ncbi:MULTISPECIES: KpsF/GutQ family sugar-phosphate isomerase [Halocynthiibacter]|uniref:KpsF/GutQ family sugar-phosphate isomerase n=1 Tax=Halocynthiibacter halioticoli TaxID=2986804 RepID=A0AAE3J0T2_9RHOB|nr:MULTISPECIES: KpsF/GutQ family sugar-phosphate isomerase [Halocynthiibacter]MCV6825655.1 KpsF/GutQ family sugar-phosphate isomerase [Halocynthiibacter halioticoli]MCW4058656.1 KpsF/GutQ family sugar-phosphate isomerase [Halocynthiibacter sp. SDUM655004]
MTLDQDKTKQIHSIGQRVLQSEADALRDFAQSLPENFDRAVELMMNAKGRIILAGIGKSGHIGRKISSTLASTGTPSFFVHPSEASHGDLGMVRPEDVCILISNSGETSELGDVIAHTRRFAIPMIAITKKPDSTLAKSADVVLLLPDVPEACLIGMAPTTSTTLSLALGDALAVALMELRDFQPENFRTYHPGGKLGAQLTKVSQLMHEGDAVPIVPSHATMQDTILVMTSKGFGIAGVVDEGKLLGVVSDGDLRRNMEDLMGRTAGEVATRSPVTISADSLAEEALLTMNTKEIGALLVVSDSGAPIGVLNIHDCLRAGVA